MSCSSCLFCCWSFVGLLYTHPTKVSFPSFSLMFTHRDYLYVVFMLISHACRLSLTWIIIPLSSVVVRFIEYISYPSIFSSAADIVYLLFLGFTSVINIRSGLLVASSIRVLSSCTYWSGCPHLYTSILVCCYLSVVLIASGSGYIAYVHVHLVRFYLQVLYIQWV